MTRKPRVPSDRIVTAVGDRRRAILDVIRGASRHIALSMYRCDDEEILAGLTEAATRGVAIDALVTTRAKGGQSRVDALKRDLEECGACVHIYPDPMVKYHAKYLIADDGPAVVASLNFTRKCFSRTSDALVVTHDPEVVAGLRLLMSADCLGQKLPDTISPRLIVGPEHARTEFKALIAGARRSVRLIDPKLSDPELLRLLDAQRTRGVAVEIHGAAKVGGLKSHGRILLIDGSRAVVGSVALTAPSLDLRREVALVVDDPTAVADLRLLFRMVGPPAARCADAAAAAGWLSC